MRILAIRGQNLASLYGPFELVLGEGPVAATGLFSISGPTGAGKSTLLDCLCLALYGCTPRLSDKGGAAVGRAEEDEDLRVASNDARGLLSRGTGAGYAAVDFEGIDGRCYRATWRVHRARKKPGGKLQGQQMELLDTTTDEPIGHSLSEVQEEIRKRVGFTFEEFRRAVVLPQFEFRAFLEARPEDRAAILERATGTEVYSRLSVAAHERAAEQKRTLEMLDQQSAAIHVLPEAERSLLEERTHTLTCDVEQAKAESKRASEAVAWHAQASRLCADAKSAAEALSVARQRAVRAEPLNRELADVEAVQPLRPAHDEADRAERARAGTAAAASKGVEDLSGAEQRLDACKVAASEAAEAAHATRAHGVEMQPALEQARRLDHQLDAARKRAEDAGSSLDRSRMDVASALTEASRLEKELAGAQAERTRSEDWLRGHAADAALSAEWPRWKAALLRHAGTVRELLQVEKSLAVIVKKAKEAAMQRASTEAEEQRAGEGLAKAEETVSAASAAAAELDLATLRPEAEVLACRLETLCELDQLTRKAAGARDAGAAAREDARVASDVMDKTRADRDRLALDQTKAEARLEAAREALTRIEAALSQDERRHALRDGDPCPLCGATEHPYARNAPGRSALEDQKAAVKREHTACKELELQVSTAEKHRAIAEERAKAAGNEERQHLKELSDATAQYAETCRGAQEADLPDRPEEAVDAVAGRRAKVERVLTEARRKQDQAIALAEAAKRAGKVLEGARKTLEEARKARAVADKAATDLAGQEERLDGDLRRLTLERTGIEAELDPPLVSRAAWREEARPDGAAFLRACERTASSFHEREASLERAAERAEVIQPRLEAARALLGEREARLRESAALAEAAGLEVRRLGEERILVLGGRMVREVEADLRHAEDKAAQSLEMARSTLGGAERAHAAAQQAARSAGDLLEQAREAEAKASAMLAQAMGKLGIDGPTLEARLAHDRQWMERRRSELDQLRLGLERAEATFSERQRLVQEHAESGQPELGPAEAQTTLREAEGRESETARALMEAQVALRQDADNRKALEAIGTELAVQKAAAARWTQLAEAIGSSDGKKFRVFAQSLALEALVANANAHLRELAPRYQLQRVPSTDLELQIADQDQGGEVRSVNSLSGGESFLVSLALALGLSSLSTRATHARTLFIDEGFGTLDRDTLEHAMVALEGLRSTGRTIGVISHVPELHERIGVQVLVEPVGLGRSRVVGPVAC